MTEAGEKWLQEREVDASRSQGWDKEAEFWLRAFCDEVEQKYNEGEVHDVGRAFDLVRRELLGD